MTPGALPAVVVPSGSNTGFSFASDSAVVSAAHALVGRDVADRDDLVVEAARRRCAAAARCCDRAAQASCSSREMPSSRDTCAFCCTMCSPSNVEVSPSKTIESISSPFPRR